MKKNPAIARKMKTKGAISTEKETKKTPLTSTILESEGKNES